jgi:hypothetical protein
MIYPSTTGVGMENEIFNAIIAVGFALAILIYRGFKDVTELLYKILSHQKFGE